MRKDMDTATQIIRNLLAPVDNKGVGGECGQLEDPSHNLAIGGWIVNIDLKD
jgi:hypothetical protein